jgi:AcrR family transcriptional regulator
MQDASAPRSRDAVRSRAEVLDVAGEVFAEVGYDGARVDEIAARTSTTKRMIYYYFGSKEALYIAVLERAYRGIRGAERAIELGDLAPPEAVRRVAELTFDHHHQHPEFIRLVAIENIHRGEYLRKIDKVRELGTPAASLLEQILEKGRADGTLRTDVDALDVHMLISAYCVFQIANSHTVDQLFDYDMRSAEVRSRNRALLGDLVVSWLRPPVSPTGA